MSELVLIAAMSQGGVIGCDKRLPWHLPQDMAFFRAQTQGHPVLMGRKTWDSLPARFRPLPGRQNIVVTRNPAWQAAGAEAAASLAQALALAGSAARKFVIGGAELYAAALPLADTLLLTEIHAYFKGDAHFPAVDPARFVEVQRQTHAAGAPDGLGFSFVTYRRR